MSTFEAIVTFGLRPEGDKSGSGLKQKGELPMEGLQSKFGFRERGGVREVRRTFLRRYSGKTELNSTKEGANFKCR